MVMSCSDLKDDLFLLIDGELDQFRQNAYSQHLSECSQCQLAHDAAKGVGKLLNGFHVGIQESAPDIWGALSLKLPSVCECIQEDLSAYLDGELIAPAKEGVAVHLDQCNQCLEKFNRLSSVNGLLSRGLSLPANVEVDIWAGVKARLNDDCALIKTELSPFIDKEVATLRHRGITQHLTECGDCKNEFHNLSETGDAIRSFYQPELNESFDLWPAIQAKMKVVPLEPKQKSRPSVMRSRRLYAAVAAVVVAGIAATTAMFMYTHTQTGPQVQPVTAEAYLIDQSLGEPADVAEAVVYDHTP